MRDPSNDIRNWLFTTLDGNVSYSGSEVPVYSFPEGNEDYPYIVLGEQSAGVEDGYKNGYMWDVANTVEIYTAFEQASDASYIPVNSISDSILQLVRKPDNELSYATSEDAVPLANFSLTGVKITSISTERRNIDNGIIIYKQLTINLLVEEDN